MQVLQAAWRAYDFILRCLTNSEHKQNASGHHSRLLCYQDVAFPCFAVHVQGTTGYCVFAPRRPSNDCLSNRQSAKNSLLLRRRDAAQWILLDVWQSLN